MLGAFELLGQVPGELTDGVEMGCCKDFGHDEIGDSVYAGQYVNQYESSGAVSSRNGQAGRSSSSAGMSPYGVGNPAVGVGRWRREAMQCKQQLMTAYGGHLSMIQQPGSVCLPLHVSQCCQEKSQQAVVWCCAVLCQAERRLRSDLDPFLPLVIP
jgi:hypothetical protein